MSQSLSELLAPVGLMFDGMIDSFPSLSPRSIDR